MTPYSRLSVRVSERLSRLNVVSDALLLCKGEHDIIGCGHPAHQYFELREAPIDFTIPHQDGRAISGFQPDTESPSSIIRIQRYDRNRGEGWRWKCQK